MNLDVALREALAREGEPAYLLDRQARIQFVNDAWDRAARADGAPERVHAGSMIGTSWLDGIGGKVRRYYRALLARAFAIPQTEPAQALVHLSEGNSPDRVRVVSHRFVPLFNESEEAAAWVLVVHAPVVESEPSDRYAVVRRAADGGYRHPKDGTVAQCSSCRRTRTTVHGETRWDFCPPLIAEPPAGVLFRVCGDCRERYFVRPSQEPLKERAAARLPRSAGLWLTARKLPVSLPVG